MFVRSSSDIKISQKGRIIVQISLQSSGSACAFLVFVPDGDVIHAPFQLGDIIFGRQEGG